MPNTYSRSDVRRVVTASLIGATIEWYDFFLYGAVAGIVFNKLFFPASDPFVSILLAYTTFAIGFVARPLGGLVFGHFGDRIGRKSVLVATLMIMGVATVLIGADAPAARAVGKAGVVGVVAIEGAYDVAALAAGLDGVRHVLVAVTTPEDVCQARRPGADVSALATFDADVRVDLAEPDLEDAAQSVLAALSAKA